MDRFLMRVRMGYPDGEAEREILRSQAGAAQLENLEPVLTGADVLEMQHAVTRVRANLPQNGSCQADLDNFSLLR